MIVGKPTLENADTQQVGPTVQWAWIASQPSSVFASVSGFRFCGKEHC